jgi:hypothetical protein
VVLSYWHKTKCHSSLDSALHKIAWYDPESLAKKKKKHRQQRWQSGQRKYITLYNSSSFKALLGTEEIARLTGQDESQQARQSEYKQ